MSTRTIHWTEDTKTMMIRTDIPEFFIEFSNQMVYRIKNTTGNTLAPGTVVRFNGSSTFPTVAIADYTTYATSEGTLGLCAHSIPNNTEGYIVTAGILRNVDLTGFTNGAEIYLHSSGSFTTTRPTAPLPEVYLGTVINSGNVGMLSVNIELGFELGEIHDMKLENVEHGDSIRWDATQNVWKNTSGSIDGGTY
jgi:hypothetical protein